MLTLIIWAGDRERMEYQAVHLSAMTHTTDINAYNSIGFSNLIVSSVAEIAHANPASLNEFTQPKFGFFFNYAPAKELYF